MAQTKIIATLGPASNSEAVLRKMYRAGVDVVRLNFSHGLPSEHVLRIKAINSLNRRLHRAVKIMQDLEGYRIRIGKLDEPIELEKNETFYLTQKNIVGKKKEAPFDYAGSLSIVKKGSLIYIDDGKIILKVTSRGSGTLKTRVIAGGVLHERKGVNILDVSLPFYALTKKDRKDVNIALQYNLDYVAQSFVRSANDIRLLKEIIQKHHAPCKIFAKVECKEALQNIDEIIHEADGIIVARGDLGICLPIYKLPVFQKEIIKKCNIHNKPVVVATQMLESMTEEKLPTRAEVSDVANAILDGADFLLLSGETAVGKHPHLVVEMMNQISKHTESYRAKLRSLL